MVRLQQELRMYVATVREKVYRIYIEYKVDGRTIKSSIKRSVGVYDAYHYSVGNVCLVRFSKWTHRVCIEQIYLE